MPRSDELGLDEIDKEGKKKGVEISHDDEADTGDDDAPELNTRIGRDTGGQIVGNLAVKQNNGATGREDKEAEKDPTKRKIPIHVEIITYFREKRLKFSGR